MLKPASSAELVDLLAYRSEGDIGPMAFLEPLDRKLRSLAPGNLVVIGGYVGSYKTLMGLNIAYNNAIVLGYNVCFVTLEMSTKEIYRRLLVRHAGNPKFRKFGMVITTQKVKDGELSEEQEDFVLNTVIPDFASGMEGPGAPYGCITILDSNDLENDNFRKALVEVEATVVGQSGRGLDLVVLDYVQLFAQYWGGKGVDRFTATGLMARWLKNFAAHYEGRGLVVVALSQLSRASYMEARNIVKNSHDKDPWAGVYSVTSFAESSEIERAANVLITIFSDEKLRAEKAAWVQLLKHRAGETIENGFRVLVTPETAYIGDFKTESVDDEYLAELLKDIV